MVNETSGNDFHFRKTKEDEVTFYYGWSLKNHTSQIEVYNVRIQSVRHKVLKRLNDMTPTSVSNVHIKFHLYFLCDKSLEI